MKYLVLLAIAFIAACPCDGPTKLEVSPMCYDIENRKCMTETNRPAAECDAWARQYCTREVCVSN